MLVDFRTTPFAFAYGTWSGNAAAVKEGVLVTKGAKGRGGCGADCTLDLDDAIALEIGLAVLNHNESPIVQLMVEDADGTNASWQIGVSQIMPTQPVWFRLPLKAANIIKPGSDGALDPHKIVKWHLQGDYATEKSLHFLAIALRARR